MVYFLISLLYIFLPGDSPGLFLLFIKASILPSLIILFIIGADREKKLMNIFMSAGLICSWAGDVFLDIPGGGDMMFMAGLVFFLLAHVNYILLFVLTPPRGLIRGNGLWYLIAVTGYGLFLYSSLHENLGSMKLPVIIYATVILLMFLAAIGRGDKVNRKSFFMVLSGAFLFVISDSALAFNKFNGGFTGAHIVVMSTYVLGQYQIVTGYLAEKT